MSGRPASPPPPAMVPGNDWRLLEPSALGRWRPTLPVTVVIPYYERPGPLRLVLAGLTAQSYPRHLIEIVVADDGSTAPPEVDGIEGLPTTTVVAQPDLGFRLAAARNLGARHAGGEILVFLDSDMIPARTLVEAHARWHHAASGLVTIGMRRHGDFTGVEPDAVAGAVAGGTLESLAGTGPHERPAWIVDHLRRTEDLTRHSEDAYRIASGGNLGVCRNLFEEAGGFDESFKQWGGEDNEFGYRLMQLGAVVIPEPAALAWHDGPGEEPSEQEMRSLRSQRRRLRHLIADPGYRQPAPGRTYERPAVVVEVPADGATLGVVEACVGTILAGDFHDLVVAVTGVGAEDAVALHREFDPDPRVRVDPGVEELAALERFAWMVARLSSPTLVGPCSLGAIVDVMKADGPGVVRADLGGATMDCIKVRARARAEMAQAIAPVPERRDIAANLFGSADFEPESLGPVIRPDSAHLLAENRSLRGYAESLSGRKAIRIADLLGRLMRPWRWRRRRS
ncbi:MAG: glycosyltransferase [Acidimicrobiia bacterium]|nr:MAG: glycosyltransferase [Acidimicrobiia bacterium]